MGYTVQLLTPVNLQAALRRGAFFDARNNNGNTALHFCYAYGHDTLGVYLITKGADATIANNQGRNCYEVRSNPAALSGGGLEPAPSGSWSEAKALGQRVQLHQQEAKQVTAPKQTQIQAPKQTQNIFPRADARESQVQHGGESEQYTGIDAQLGAREDEWGVWRAHGREVRGEGGSATRTEDQTW